MKRSPGSAERWWSRHAWITVIACGLLGALTFYAVVRSLIFSDDPVDCCFGVFVAGFPGVGLVFSTMAGLLFGVLAAVLLIRLGRSGGIDCPRCGTFNDRHSVACSACSLPLG
jgi:hypothetical protein